MTPQNAEKYSMSMVQFSGVRLSRAFPCCPRLQKFARCSETQFLAVPVTSWHPKRADPMYKTTGSVFERILYIYIVYKYIIYLSISLGYSENEYSTIKTEELDPSFAGLKGPVQGI